MEQLKKKKNYAAFLARFPELLSLEIDEDELFSGGFSYVIEITDAKEPFCFRKTARMSQWQNAMQKKYDSLRA